MIIYQLDCAENDYYDNSFNEEGIFTNLAKVFSIAEQLLQEEYPPDRLLITQHELQGDEFVPVKTWFKDEETNWEWEEEMVEND